MHDSQLCSTCVRPRCTSAFNFHHSKTGSLVKGSAYTRGDPACTFHIDKRARMQLQRHLLSRRSTWTTSFASRSHVEAGSRRPASHTPENTATSPGIRRRLLLHADVDRAADRDPIIITRLFEQRMSMPFRGFRARRVSPTRIRKTRWRPIAGALSDLGLDKKRLGIEMSGFFLPSTSTWSSPHCCRTRPWSTVRESSKRKG